VKLYRFAFVPFAMFAAACGGDGNSISIVGEPHADQAAEIAGAICDQVVECGEASFEFTGSEPLMCTATIEPGDEAECLSENEPDILADLEACNFTAEQEQLIQDCVNAQLALPCVTQAELDDICEQYEAGEEPTADPLPEPCPEAFALLDECGADQT
jgi:hypothetical protein